jgi:hypothetical protein
MIAGKAITNNFIACVMGLFIDHARRRTADDVKKVNCGV